jgi:UDP-2,3-diacylglucosamine pyrophosphatase LpxH
MMQHRSCLEVDPQWFRGRTIVVVGDVHLHAGSSAALAADLARLVSDSTQREPRCAIVFNGDAFDLDRVQGQDAWGAGHEAAAQRLAAVLDAFPLLTAALADHVVDQGMLVFVAGNHDAELLAPRVQQVLQNRLLSADVRDEPASRAPRVLAVARLSLPPVLIEHGHQTDPDSTFYPDMQSAVGKQRLSAFPLASLFARFFLSHCPRYEALGDIYRTPLAVLLRVLRDYRLAALAMIARYPLAALHITWQAVLAGARKDVPSATAQVSMSSPFAVVRRLYLDRYLGVLVAALLSAAIALGGISPHAWWVVIAIALYLSVPPSRRTAFHHRDVRQCENEAIAHFARGFQLVVFGHLHRAFVTHIGEAIYANHGAFSLPVEIDPHGQVCTSTQDRVPPSGQPRLARPYLSITTEPLGCDLLVLT